jgi:prolyl-tRNA synthetase
LAAAIEQNHDANGIIWPESVAPFQIILINLKPGEAACDKLCNDLYKKLLTKNIEVLYDDTKTSIGQKFATADLIGIPTQMIVGPRGAANGIVEVKNRKNGDKKEVDWTVIT